MTKTILLNFGNDKAIGLKFVIGEWGDVYTAMATPEFFADLENFLEENMVKSIKVITDESNQS